MKQRLLPRFTDFFFILLFFSALMTGPKMLNIDGDLPRHLLLGKVVLETGVAPTQEIFSYVYESRPYTPHEWLAGVIYYAAYLAFGLNGVVLLASILIAGTFVVLYSEAVSLTGNFFLTFALTLLGALVTSIHWITRPHLFTMLFLAVWVILIDRLYRGMPVKIWIFPALMLFWANIHAEFIAGFLVLMAYIAGCAWAYLLNRSQRILETGKNLLRIAFVCFIASAVNPVGLRTWDIVFGYVNNRYLLSRIAETRPPDFTQGEYWPLLTLLGIAIYLLAIRRDKFAPAHVLLVAGFGVMSLLSARNAHLAGVVFPFVLSRALTHANEVQPLARVEAMIKRMENQAKSTVWSIAIIVMSALLLTGSLGRLNRFEPSVFPVEAVRWLETHPPTGRMFNAFDWGGYLLFHLWPEQKVFIESQTDVTGEATRQYETIVTLQEGWQEVLERYDISWAILPPHWALTLELRTQGWQTAYQDQTTVILIRE